ncbi:bifunctional 3-oxoadipate enol-lactonase/4-carboxymuconolactone decarboxylase PcaDC [Jatrophihabitans sp. YIM 134969]
MSTPRLSLVPLSATADARPLLVLGPSIGTTARTLWGRCAVLLSARFEIVGFDLPGHGDQPPVTSSWSIDDLADAVVEAAAAHRPGPFHYAGDSIGGAVGLTLAVHHPGSLLTATLACTGAVIGTPEGWKERAAAVRAHGMAPQVKLSAGRWFAPGFREREPRRAQALLDALAATDQESFALACEALGRYDVRDRLPGVRTPLTLIGGTHDVPTPLAGLRSIEQQVPGSRLVELDVGHQAPAESPAAVAALIATTADTTDERHAAGMAVRRAVLGDRWVDRATASTTEATRDFQDFITRYAWGTVWTRPGLPRRDRSIVTLTALVAGGHHEELAGHLRGALRNGLTRDEIAEVLLQTAIYCGVPAANTAFRVAQRVFDEIDRETPR